MTRIRFSAACSALLCLLLVTTNSCLKDKLTHTFQIQSPIYETLTQARSVIQGGGATPIQAAGKICLYKNYIFLNDPNIGVHIIDNSNPAQPKNISFINLPGNYDIAIKDDMLFADEAFGDLVVLDIKDPTQVSVKKFIPQVFNYYGSSSAAINPDSVQVIKGWITKDTTVNISGNLLTRYYPGFICAACASFQTAGPSTNATGTSSGTTATNGSSSSFAISNNNLYALSYGSQINVLDVTHAADPALINRVILSDFTQTIYPLDNKLFLGSYNGMLIYDISDPATPTKQAVFTHARVCDPVIADGADAFVTLHSGTTCQGFTNQLDILDISNLSNPTLIKTYQLTSPRGLSKDGSLLFICDGTDGLKIYDATDLQQLVMLKTAGGFLANDVIAQNGLAVVLAADGLYQFDYSDTKNIQQLSKLTIHAATQ